MGRENHIDLTLSDNLLEELQIPKRVLAGALRERAASPGAALSADMTWANVQVRSSLEPACAPRRGSAPTQPCPEAQRRLRSGTLRDGTWRRCQSRTPRDNPSPWRARG